jgi:hypothetical protein
MFNLINGFFATRHCRDDKNISPKFPYDFATQLIIMNVWHIILIINYYLPTHTHT